MSAPRIWLLAPLLVGLLGVSAAVSAMAGAMAGALCFALFAALLLLVARALPAPVARTPEPRWQRLALVALALLLCAVWVEHTLRFPDAFYDAWMIWNARARALYRGGDLATLLSPQLAQADWKLHLDYPLLLPGLVALGFRASGGESRWVPALVSLAFALLALGALRTSLLQLRGAERGTLAALALCSTPCFPALAAGQIADLPLATLLLCAFALLALAERAPPRERASLAALAGFSLGLASWTKNEGILLSCCVALALFSLSPLSSRRRDLPALVAGALPLAALLLWFKLGFAPPGDLLHGAPPLDALPARLAQVLATALRHLVYFQDWGLHLVAFVAALAWLRRRGALPAPARLVLRALGLALCADLVVYLATPHELGWHLRTSLDRLWFQLWPSALFALFLALPEAQRQEETASTSAAGVVAPETGSR